MAKPRPDLNGVAALYRARALVERGIVPNDDSFRQRCPSIFGYLTQNTVGEGQVIDGSFLRVSVSAGDWCVSLGIPALGAYCEVLAATVDEGLAKLDSALATGAAAWRWSVKRKARVREVKDLKKET